MVPPLKLQPVKSIRAIPSRLSGRFHHHRNLAPRTIVSRSVSSTLIHLTMQLSVNLVKEHLTSHLTWQTTTSSLRLTMVHFETTSILNLSRFFWIKVMLERQNAELSQVVPVMAMNYGVPQHLKLMTRRAVPVLG